MAQRTPEGPPPPPVVQKLRLRYARRGRLRFSSGRDFARALERALRRAGVPMAYSAGFHPHPKISYANAAATGVESESEYVEIGLAQRVDPEALRQALDAALPDGIDVVAAVEAQPGSLADRLQASRWAIRLPGEQVGPVTSAVRTLLAAEHANVSRMTKKGERVFDVRPAVVSMQVSEEDGTPRVEVVLRHVTPMVRPDDVVSAFSELCDLRPQRAPRVIRLEQGLLNDDGSIGDPFAPDTCS